MRLTSSGGWDSWREEGEATMVRSGAYPPLIGAATDGSDAMVVGITGAVAVVPCH